MKRVTEQIGKNTEEAIRKGLEELKVSRGKLRWSTWNFICKDGKSKTYSR